jgi:UDP-glucose 4-epimerase
MPYITQVACGKLAQLKIYGNDYPTIDGTGVRDYIHVVDLAKGHIAALNALFLKKGMIISNLGTGKGVSVLTLVKEFERVNKVRVPYVVTNRRKGDIAECWTSTEYAVKHLKWSAEYDIEQMCIDAWNWQRQSI